MSVSSHQIVAQQLLSARKTYPKEALLRIERAFLQYAGLRAPIRSEHRLQRPNWFFPGLYGAAWPEPERLPALAELEGHAPAIRAEVLQALAQNRGTQTWNDGTPHQGSWQSIVIRYGSKTVAQTAPHLPLTSSLINNLAGIGEMAMVSIIGPGTHIKAHCGLHNFRWTAHLGIDVPEGDCAFRVGDETRHWQNDRCLLFDDSFEHEAWNRTEQRRVVLLFDLWHPELTEIERTVLDQVAEQLASLRSRVLPNNGEA